jgi:probable F420-dependent oxidoreductase
VRVGLSAYDIDPGELVELTAAADELGFSTVWLGEHVVLPVGYRSAHPASGSGAHDRSARPIVDPATRLVDPLVALAGCAARTRSIRLATGIYLLPLRQPVLAARMVHTLHQLSGGRFVLGVGAGWLAEEFAAVGVPFAGRGARLEENLALLRAALAGGPVHHTGPLHTVDGVQLCAEPAPVPVVLGGNTERALRRAARLGDGWFCSGTPELSDAVAHRDRLLVLLAEQGRTAPFPLHVRVPLAEPELLARYAAAGFDEVVVWADQVWPATGDLAAKRAALAGAAQRLGVSPRSPGTVPAAPALATGVLP